MNTLYQINPEIKEAATLPGNFYTNAEVFEKAKDLIFSRTWQFIGEQNLVRLAGQAYPFSLLEGYLDEPLVLTRDENEKIHCLSNVCTHRGNLVVNHSGAYKSLQCRYHGKRFGLDGCFKAIPEFKEARNFPTEADNLPQLPLHQWGSLLFTSINPAFSFEDFFGEMQARLAWMPLENLIYHPSLSRDYLVKANWALYCDNYLEGFHIPFVHEALNNLLDYGSYTTEIFKYCNLQLGIAKKGEPSFQLPSSSPDYGREVAAYYFWVFPNLMFNFYPWGLSVNVVKPLGINLTKVSFLTFAYSNEPMQEVIAYNLDKTEREDEEVVECVQKGVKSRFYKAGRYSPTMEKGVHHFHSLLVDFLGK
jgi:choline monooxygenase